MKTGRHRFARLAAVIAAAAALLPLLSAPAPAPASRIDEYAVKAALLFNVSRMTRWPAALEYETGRPFLISVVGDQRFAERLESVVARRTIDGRPVRVRSIDDVSAIGAANVVFVAGDSPARMRAVLEASRGRSVLVVGDSLDLLREGASVCFVREQHRLRIAVNLRASRGSGLTFSSQLLKIARLIEGDVS